MYVMYIMQILLLSNHLISSVQLSKPLGPRMMWLFENMNDFKLFFNEKFRFHEKNVFSCGEKLKMWIQLNIEKTNNTKYVSLECSSWE